MDDGAFRIYLQAHEQEYARDRMITDYQTLEEALATTRTQHTAMLPHGLQTPGHFFCTACDADRDIEVGTVWFACPESSVELFVYHIQVHPERRRQGYGRAILGAIEERAKELGRRVVWLNVMGHNHSAIDFYLACGYRIAAMHLNKSIASVPPASS
jgi:ribosomal protein S18 acetylase RimI-like enzyme